MRCRIRSGKECRNSGAGRGNGEKVEGGINTRNNGDGGEGKEEEGNGGRSEIAGTRALSHNRHGVVESLHDAVLSEIDT